MLMSMSPRDAMDQDLGGGQTTSARLGVFAFKPNKRTSRLAPEGQRRRSLVEVPCRPWSFKGRERHHIARRIHERLTWSNFALP
jgi:hypothetical protein